MQHANGFTSHLQMGGLALQQQQPADAVREFQAAARQRPQSVPAHFALAEAYYEQHDFGHAEAELKRVIELLETPKKL